MRLVGLRGIWLLKNHKMMMKMTIEMIHLIAMSLQRRAIVTSCLQELIQRNKKKSNKPQLETILRQLSRKLHSKKLKIPLLSMKNFS